MLNYFDLTEIIGITFIVLGSFFMLTGVLGLIRFKDFFTRIHAASLVDSIGAPLFLLGIILLVGFNLISLKICLIMALLLLTNSTASHILAKTVFIKNKHKVSNLK